jgi:hypothetical protein
MRSPVGTDTATAPPNPHGPLSRRVAALCGSVEFREPHLNDQLTKLVRALGEPLRVAFAGRVSMGKSTLVNALLCAAIAPTGDRETTKVVTRFETGEFERVELRLRDGTTSQAFLTPDGVLPPSYPISSEKIQEVRVRLPYAPILQRATLIDTPGLESLNQEASERTSESLFSCDSRAAIAEADALVYLLRIGSEDDAAAVAAFNELTAIDRCALNTVGVLSCKTEHSVGEQERVARRLKNEPEFRNKVADIVPLAGLLAYTVCSATLAEHDVTQLRRLVAIDADDLLIDVDEFLEAPCDVAQSERQRLLGLLGIAGLRIALQTVRSASGRLSDINAALLQESGLPRLMQILDGTFVNCADQIKAGQTLVALTRLSYQADPATGHRIRVMIETLREDPELHGIQELWALQACTRPDVELPQWVPAELARVAAEITPAAKLGMADGAPVQEILEAALDGESRAHSYASGLSMTRPEARIAETLRRSYTNIYRDSARA